MSDITTTLTRKQVSDGDLSALTLTLVKTDAGVQGDLDSSRNLPNVNSIKFDTTPTGVSTHLEGQLFYDEDWKTLSAHLGRDCTLQIGEEEWRRVYNDTGAIIAEAKAVYTTGAYAGAGAGYPAVATVALADASDSAKWQALGVTTQEIPINGYGFVTVRGHVNGINTTGFAAGDTLYLCPTTPGCLTNVAPESPNYKVRMGRCITSAASGRINVRIIANSKLEDLSNVFAPSPAVDDVMKWGGVNWINGPAGAVSAGPGIDFHCATPSIVAKTADNAFPILTLSKTPVVTAEQTIAGTGDNASTQIPFAAWLYDAALGRTAIDAGKWTFDIYAAISNASGTTTITRQAYAVLDAAAGTVTITSSGTSRTVTASAGTPFDTAKITASANPLLASYLRTPKGLYQITARTNDTVVTIATPTAYVNEAAVAYGVWQLVPGVTATTADISATGTAYALNSNEVSAAAFTITALHKFGSINFIASTASRVVTTTYNGTTRQAAFTTPLVTLHNNLAGLQGDSASELYHLTAAQKALVGASSAEIGEIRRFPGGVPSALWRACDGAAYLQSTYPLPYAAVGLLHDFAAWTSTGQATNQINRIAYGGGRFMCGQVSGGVLFSTDGGATWTQGVVAVGSTAWVNVRALAYSPTLGAGAGRWLAGGNTGLAWYSDDGGATWTSIADPKFSTSQINGACWTGAVFLLAGNDGKTAYSADGINWTGVTTGSAHWQCVASSGTRAIFGGEPNAYYSDDNGATMVACPTLSHILYDVVWVDGIDMFVGGGTTYQLSLTKDGGSWRYQLIDRNTAEIRRLATDGYGVVFTNKANGSVFLMKPDLTVAPLPYLLAQANLGGVAYGGGQWVIGNLANPYYIARASFSYNTATSFRVPSPGLDAGIFADSYIYFGS